MADTDQEKPEKPDSDGEKTTIKLKMNKLVFHLNLFQILVIYSNQALGFYSILNRKLVT
jgi:hypothetical protein